MRLNRYDISHPFFISLSLSSNQFSSMYIITITSLIRSFETTSSLSYLLHFLLMLLSYFIYLTKDICRNVNIPKTHMFMLLKYVAIFWILHVNNCIFMYGPLMYYFWRCNEITTKGPSVRRRSSIKTSHLNSACILLSMGERHEITWCIM